MLIAIHRIRDRSDTRLSNMTTLNSILCSVLLLNPFALHAQIGDSLLYQRFGMGLVHSSMIGEYHARPEDSAVIRALDSFLLEHVPDLWTRFEHHLDGPVRFEFFPSLNAAQHLCGWDTLTARSDDRTRLGCAHYIRKIQMVMPGTSIAGDSIYAAWGGFQKVMLHEYTHSMTYDIIGDEQIDRIPWWITEGLACLVAEQFHYGPSFRDLVQQRLDESSVPSVKDLHTDYLHVELLYGWSWLLCDFITTTYGWDRMLAIQSDFKHPRRILGRSYKALDREWLDHLRNKPAIHL